jgi:D-alanyl-D-alanine carboxypeptidase/D-alanyl-D-alanine-endopeptidase (penicillin-binding protein 4)
MKRLSIISLAALLLCTPSFSPIASAAEKSEKTLTSRLEEVVNGPNYKHAHWGLLIVDQEGGNVFYEHNADKLFAPASTTKLFSVASALDAFGPEHRFETPVYRRGKTNDAGELTGDLILVAQGDLTLGGRADAEGRIAFKDTDHTYANGSSTAELTMPDPLAGLDDLARQVAAAGVKRVRGDVLIDDRLFDKAESTGSGPTRLTPILVNDNVIDLQITPASTGSPATVQWRPSTSAFEIDARVETVAKDQEPRVQVTVPSPGRIVVRGRVATESKPLVRVVEVDDPASFARSLFIEALRRAGVVVDASPLASNSAAALPARDSYKSEDRVALLTSAPFSEEMKLVLKVSHNLHASTLPLLVAVKNGKRTLAEGLHLQHDFLSRAKVDVDTISFGGGAGGSRSDFTTPRATVQLLRYMATRPDFATYESALPVIGVDGTLASVIDANSPARGKVHAKTGTLLWENTMNTRFLLTSKALAGYMTTAKGRKLAFAMFVNLTHMAKASETTREGRTLGRLCEVVYEEL